MSSPSIRRITRQITRSEEHTSELQSQSNLVCRLLLEKKKHHLQLHPHTRTNNQPTAQVLVPPSPACADAQPLQRKVRCLANPRPHYVPTLRPSRPSFP